MDRVKDTYTLVGQTKDGKITLSNNVPFITYSNFDNDNNDTINDIELVCTPYESLENFNFVQTPSVSHLKMHLLQFIKRKKKKS